MKAPFPWFGGKSRVAPLVWRAFGDVVNYVEPFAGSLAVLLGRPTRPRIETVNDVDCYVANFWRALQSSPDELARHADWPVNEADLHARHRWLVDRVEFRERMKVDPEYFDVKVAGWWVWGLCQWIGSGWCSQPEWQGTTKLGNEAPGDLSIERERPHLNRGGRGVGRVCPHLTARQIPCISGAGQGIHASGRAGKILQWMQALAERLRLVRVCCGDWSRILGPSPTTSIGVTGVFLDPPYAEEAGRDRRIYAHDDLSVAHDVRAWALSHGDDPKLRIALCGYEGEHAMPSSWRCIPWQSAGGYGGQRKNGKNGNATRERVWLSPHCLGDETQLELGLRETVALIAPCGSTPAVAALRPRSGAAEPQDQGRITARASARKDRTLPG